MKIVQSLFLIAGLVLLLPQSGHAQVGNNVDINQKYKYPLAFGLDYKSFSPVVQMGTDYGDSYLFNDFSFSAFYPLPAFPTIQPFGKVGFGIFGYGDDILSNEDRFDSRQLYIEAGAAYRNMLSKQLEIGADISTGIVQVYYNTDPSGEGSENVGQKNFITEAGIRVGFNLSYNININFNPMLRYTLSLNNTLDSFDGFTYGLGISGSYRLGEDPDAPQAEIRSLRIDKLEFPAVFAPMQSYYAKNPLTSVTIENIEKQKVTNLSVAFFQAGFMDSPTLAAEVEELKPSDSVTVDIPAIFNTQIFSTEGITPLTGEIQISYSYNGRPAKQSFPVSYDLYDKESLTWDDDNKVGAFITPADSALRNYSSFVRQTCKDYTIDGFSQELQTAMQLYYALEELGVLYQKDPTSPFESAQGNPMIVDAISLPRNTLTRATGDCDDLTVLFCSLLESVGIETGFITVPGHIYAAFKTSVPSKNYNLLHPDKNMTINIDGELWVPVEITLIGETDFLSAWRTGIEEFTAYDDDPSKRQLYISRKSQEVYRPVVLTEKDLGLQYGDRTKIVSDFSGNLDKIVNLIIEDFENDAIARGSKGSYNKLGITCAMMGQYSKAEQAFNSALSLDRNYLSPRINLGNVYYMKGEYQNALRLLHGAEKTVIEGNKESSSSYSYILLSISKCYYELENFDKANDYITKLYEVDPQIAGENSYLTTGGEGQRAADRSSRINISFAEE